MSEYEHVILNGIPYFKEKDNKSNTIYTFDQYNTPIAIGSYTTHADGKSNVELFVDWKERVRDALNGFRTSIIASERDKIRENIIKPTKQRKTPRNSRKSTRTKSIKTI